MTRNKWSKEEVKFLRQSYATMDAPAIGRYLGKTAKSVLTKAQRLGIKASKRANRCWFTKEEDKFIMDNQHLSHFEMAEALGKRYSVVRSRCYDFGLKKKKGAIRWTDEMIDVIKAHLADSGDFEIARMLSERFQVELTRYDVHSIRKRRGIERTDEQKRLIKKEIGEKSAFRKARAVLTDMAQKLTDEYIVKCCLQMNPNDMQRFKQEHKLLIDLKRREILNKREKRRGVCA